MEKKLQRRQPSSPPPPPPPAHSSSSASCSPPSIASSSSASFLSSFAIGSSSSASTNSSSSSTSGSSGSTCSSSSTSEDDSSFSDDENSPSAIAKRCGPPTTDIIPPAGPVQATHKLLPEVFTSPSLRQYDMLLPYGEQAIVKEWSVEGSCWKERYTNVVVCLTPFARGSMRSSYYLIDLNALDVLMVAKRYRKSSVGEDQYFADVSMQTVAEHWATMFNRYSPPKKIRFVPACLVELVGRSTKVILAAERHLEGEFRKHNSNYGYVAKQESESFRCTPQAFTHFTHHYSSGQLMVCDMQGVGDTYTDPQIHTADGEGFGRGNMGKKGMIKFLETHICNAVCQKLNIPLLKRNVPMKAAGASAAAKEVAASGGGEMVDSPIGRSNVEGTSGSPPHHQMQGAAFKDTPMRGVVAEATEGSGHGSPSHTTDGSAIKAVEAEKKKKKFLWPRVKELLGIGSEAKKKIKQGDIHTPSSCSAASSVPNSPSSKLSPMSSPRPQHNQSHKRAGAAAPNDVKMQQQKTNSIATNVTPPPESSVSPPQASQNEKVGEVRKKGSEKSSRLSDKRGLHCDPLTAPELLISSAAAQQQKKNINTRDALPHQPPLHHTPKESSPHHHWENRSSPYQRYTDPSHHHHEPSVATDVLLPSQSLLRHSLELSSSSRSTAGALNPLNTSSSTGKEGRPVQTASTTNGGSGGGLNIPTSGYFSGSVTPTSIAARSGANTPAAPRSRTGSPKQHSLNTSATFLEGAGNTPQGVKQHIHPPNKQSPWFLDLPPAATPAASSASGGESGGTRTPQQQPHSATSTPRSMFRARDSTISTNAFSRASSRGLGTPPAPQPHASTNNNNNQFLLENSTTSVPSIGVRPVATTVSMSLEALTQHQQQHQPNSNDGRANPLSPLSTPSVSLNNSSSALYNPSTTSGGGVVGAFDRPPPMSVQSTPPPPPMATQYNTIGAAGSHPPQHPVGAAAFFVDRHALSGSSSRQQVSPSPNALQRNNPLGYAAEEEHHYMHSHQPAWGSSAAGSRPTSRMASRAGSQENLTAGVSALNTSTSSSVQHPQHSVHNSPHRDRTALLNRSATLDEDPVASDFFSVHPELAGSYRTSSNSAQTMSGTGSGGGHHVSFLDEL